ncbi:MAG: hypothetical protein ACT4RN_06170 [Pseudonocardia sp.]
MAFAQVHEYLRRTGRWLVVFDIDGPSDSVRDLLPSGPGHVLVIGDGQHGWAGATATLAVGPFERAESRDLLGRCLPGLGEADADELAEELGDLPMALHQAANAILAAGLPAAGFLAMYRDCAAEALALATGGAGSPLAASWTVAFDRLATDDLAALQLVTLVAWLAPEPVPLTILTSHPQLLPAPLAEAAADPLRLARCRAVLGIRGIARIQGAVELHRVPAALLRGRTTESDPDWPACAARVVRAAAPEDPRPGGETWQRWQGLLPHVRAVVERDRPAGAAEDVEQLVRLLRTSEVPTPTGDTIGDAIAGVLTPQVQAMLALMEPKDRARYLLQKKQQQRAEVTALLSQLQGLRHSTAMSVIRNIR